jgi:P pilus assembly chaperone PapD
MTRVRSVMIRLAAVLTFLLPAPAHADLVLSELIVELQPGKVMRDDIEVWNNSSARSYVFTEPREIIDPSLSSQRDRKDPDPEKLGLLVEPARMILEPGQRRLVRIAAFAASTDREHVYRVTIKPVLGTLRSEESGLKVVVGYDVLVLLRPSQPAAHVTASRAGRKLRFSNLGNVSVEVIEGRQCAAAHTQCTELPGKRLYPGASWTVDLPSDLPAEYTLKSPGRSDHGTY